MRKLLAVCALVACSSSGGVAGEINPDETVRAADVALRKIVEDPKYPIPQSVLAEAQGLLIIPQSTEFKFVVGSRSCRGVLLVRDDAGQWSTPKFVSVKGSSIGCQAGRTCADTVQVFMNRKFVDEFLKRGTFKIVAGAIASSNVSPIKNWLAARNERPKSEIKYYSNVSGLGAGIMLAVERMKLDSKSDAAYYKSEGARQAPASAVALLANLATYSSPGPVNAANSPAVSTRTIARPPITEVRR